MFGSRVFTRLLDDSEVADGSVMQGEFTAILQQLSIGDTMLVSLSNITYEYHDFLSRIKSGFLGPGLLMEPYNLPTNVENGYGYFNLYFRDSYLLELDD